MLIAWKILQMVIVSKIVVPSSLLVHGSNNLAAQNGSILQYMITMVNIIVPQDKIANHQAHTILTSFSHAFLCW